MWLNDSPIKGNKILLWLARWQEKHWFISLIFVRLSAIWYSLIIAFAGESLGLVFTNAANNKRLSWYGWTISIFLLLLTVLFEAAKLYYQEKKPVHTEEYGFLLLNNLRVRINALFENRQKQMLGLLKKKLDNEPIALFDIIGNPKTNLDIIAEKMRECLCELLLDENNPSWKSDDLFVGIAYNFPQTGLEWHWAISQERGLDLIELTKQPSNGENKSTLRYLLDSKAKFVLYNSKSSAYKDKRYIPDELDEYKDPDKKEGLLGSIACYKGSTRKDGKEIVQFAIMISTYGKRFTEKEDNETIDNIKHNMKEFVLKDFEMRIEHELSYLFLIQ